MLQPLGGSGINVAPDPRRCMMFEPPIDDAKKHFNNPDLPPEEPVNEQRPSEDEAIEIVTDNPAGLRKKIKSFDHKQLHEDNWARTPNTTGQGAIHVRTFFSRLSEDSFTYMDESVNEWLDSHPQYEVKFVNSSIGTMRGKTGPQDVLICQVWV